MELVSRSTRAFTLFLRAPFRSYGLLAALFLLEDSLVASLNSFLPLSIDS